MILVGVEDRVKASLADLGGSDEVPVVHAPQVVEMDDSPVKAARQKPNSSMALACRLIKDGRAEAVVSAGNSGAMMANAVLILGRVKGIERPALATIFPSLEDPTVVIDVGANVDSQPRHMCQFGIMGSQFAAHILGHESPRVGLLSVGEEDVKGNDQTRRTLELLKKAPINFIGNVEGRDMFSARPRSWSATDLWAMSASR